MKPLVHLTTFVLFLSCSLIASADDTDNESEILAQRGNGVVTQTMFAARADKIPADIRVSTLRNGNRLRDVINTLLLRAQLAADAREAGFDKQQIVIDRMKLVAESELAEAWVENYVDNQPAGDYEALAREYFLLNQDGMLSPPMIDVSHILIATKERPLDEARALADTVSEQIEKNPLAFDELVMEYSEDPSSRSNKGKFTKVKKGDMVKAFEDAAFALEEGEISAPVETEFGFHIIRLDAFYPPSKVTFDDVREQLVGRERQRHNDRVKNDYLSGLTALDVKMTEEALAEMVRRQIGED